MPNTGIEEEYYRLRHFSITGKGVVNRGDSLLDSRRSRSNTSVASSTSSNEAGIRASAPCSLASSRDSSAGLSSYRVLVLGAPGVGKSSLVGQFMTSEYLHAYDTSIDDESGERSVCVLLAGEESEITFLDAPPDHVVRKKANCKLGLFKTRVNRRLLDLRDTPSSAAFSLSSRRTAVPTATAWCTRRQSAAASPTRRRGCKRSGQQGTPRGGQSSWWATRRTWPGRGLSPLMVLTALFFFASGSYQKPIGVAKHISQKVCSTYIEQVTEALTHKNMVGKYIKFPDTLAARQAVSQGFYRNYGIPGVVGCIDGSHFKIVVPAKEEEQWYYSRKHCHSLNLSFA